MTRAASRAFLGVAILAAPLAFGQSGGPPGMPPPPPEPSPAPPVPVMPPGFFCPHDDPNATYGGSPPNETKQVTDQKIQGQQIDTTVTLYRCQDGQWAKWMVAHRTERSEPWNNAPVPDVLDDGQPHPHSSASVEDTDEVYDTVKGSLTSRHSTRNSRVEVDVGAGGTLGTDRIYYTQDFCRDKRESFGERSQFDSTFTNLVNYLSMKSSRGVPVGSFRSSYLGSSNATASDDNGKVTTDTHYTYERNRYAVGDPPPRAKVFDVKFSQWGQTADADRYTMEVWREPDAPVSTHEGYITMQHFTWYYQGALTFYVNGQKTQKTASHMDGVSSPVVDPTGKELTPGDIVAHAQSHEYWHCASDPLNWAFQPQMMGP